MSVVPTIVKDNFFKEPWNILKYANSLDFSVTHNNYPGTRSECLSKLNHNLYLAIMYKVMGNLYDLSKSTVNYKADLQFQKITGDYIGGWVHLDIPCQFTFIIYLDEEPDPESGTILYNVKNKYKHKDLLEIVNSPVNKKEESFADKSLIPDTEKYRLNLLNHFDESIKVYNKFNRMIMFDANQPHAQGRLQHSEGTERLTLVGFVQEVSNIMQNVHAKEQAYSSI